MRDPESRNAIAVAPSSALQTHTNASWHLSSPGKRTARAAGSSSSSQQKTIRGHGWGLKFGTAAATRHKLFGHPPHCSKWKQSRCQRYVDIACVKLPPAMTTPKHKHNSRMTVETL